MVTIFLLIDDDPDDRDLFCEALYEIDPQIICYAASSGRKALELLEREDVARPDIIFLDLNMPKMNGWQCLSLLKEQTCQSIPVILYSTTSHIEDLHKVPGSGALCFYTKPNDYKTLKVSLAQVTQHLERRTLSSLVQSDHLFMAGLNEEKNE